MRPGRAQVGYKVVREKNIKNPELGHCKKAGTPPLRHLVEFKVKSAEQLEGMDVGSEVDLASLFEPNQLVDVAGRSIGKGFAGSIKRWGHARGPMTHGAHEAHFALAGTAVCRLHGSRLMGSRIQALALQRRGAQDRAHGCLTSLAPNCTQFEFKGECTEGLCSCWSTWT
jgi:ribosomal protein L3